MVFEVYHRCFCYNVFTNFAILDTSGGVLLMESESNRYLLSIEVDRGVLRIIPEKLGWLHVLQIHDMSLLARLLNRVVDIPRHCLWFQTLQLSQQMDSSSHVTGSKHWPQG